MMISPHLGFGQFGSDNFEGIVQDKTPLVLSFPEGNKQFSDFFEF